MIISYSLMRRRPQSDIHWFANTHLFFASGCLFQYQRRQKLKTNVAAHELVVLHEHGIRKGCGAFKALHKRLRKILCYD